MIDYNYQSFGRLSVQGLCQSCECSFSGVYRVPLLYKGALDFTVSTESGTEYTYDGDGRLTGDRNRGIAKIDYDVAGNPRRVQYMDGSVTEYVYTAAGEKLRAVHRTAAPNVSVAFGQTKELTASETLNVDSTDYYGSLTAENGEAKIYNFGGGYCTFDGACKFHYFDRDHQGNVRAVVSPAGTIEQILNYYPFGAPYCDNTTLNPDLQPYKYNGKEFETMHGRNAYDYGARFYDPLLPTWDRMDPLCEKYYYISPYAYCANDPVNRIDFEGKRDYKINSDGYFYESTSLWEQLKSFLGFGTGLDRIYVEQGSENPIAVYPEGTIERLENSGFYTMLNVKNERYANDLFQKLIRFTDVEWANSRFEKGNYGYNQLMNTHSDISILLEGTPFNENMQNGFILKYFEHSHPIPKEIKKYGSNMPYKLEPSNEDKSEAKKYPQAEFRIFDLKDDIIYQYDHEKDEFKIE